MACNSRKTNHLLSGMILQVSFQHLPVQHRERRSCQPRCRRYLHLQPLRERVCKNGCGKTTRKTGGGGKCCFKREKPWDFFKVKLNSVNLRAFWFWTYSEHFFGFGWLVVKNTSALIMMREKPLVLRRKKLSTLGCLLGCTQEVRMNGS